MLLRCELHAHSDLSDGIDSVSDLLREALRKDIHVLSITDHDSLEGSFQAIEIVENRDLPILILPGYELSAKEGHLLVFGEENRIEVLQKEIKIREAIQELGKKGCVTALAHPYQFYRNGVQRPSKIVSSVDAIEVFNSRSIIPFFNKMAMNLARKYGKAMIAGSDAHSSKGIGFGVTVVDSKPDVKEILKAIKAGNTMINSEMFPLKDILKEGLVKRKN